MQILPTLAFTNCQDRVLVLVHGTERPSEEDWNAWTERIRMDLPRNDEMGAVVVTPHGVGPNARQRKQLTLALNSKYRRTAIMSEHRATRAIVTALSWFNSGLRVFGEDDFEGVQQYLRTSPEVIGELRTVVARLKSELDPAQAS